jgi:spore coat polysaccharide biosynthesis predicted glycosyltransferase SpsG
MRAGATVTLVMSRPEPSVRASALPSGLTIRAIDVAPGTPDDAAATRAIAGDGGWVVVDGYVFDSAYLERLRGERRIVMSVDDGGDKALPCEVVLNPNVSGERTRYAVGPDVTLLAGPDYALVHDRFIDARAQRIARSRPEVPARLLVTLGGSDPVGATITVIEALSLLDAVRFEVRVVVGAANPRGSEVRAAASSCVRHDVEVRTAVEDMAAEMLWADLAVTASGVTATELSCVGVPGVTFAIADNQQPIAAELARRGMFEVLERTGADAPAIARALAQLAADGARQARMAEVQRATIDGHGKDRVIQRLLSLRGAEGHTRVPDGGDGV